MNNSKWAAAEVTVAAYLDYGVEMAPSENSRRFLSFVDKTVLNSDTSYLVSFLFKALLNSEPPCQTYIDSTRCFWVGGDAMRNRKRGARKKMRSVCGDGSRINKQNESVCGNVSRINKHSSTKYILEMNRSKWT